MASPVTPNDIEETIPAPGGNRCEKLLKATSINALLHRLISYVLQEDGNFTEAVKSSFCQTCGSSSGSGLPGTGGTGLSAPAIDATDGSHLGKVVISWTGVADATMYEVYRNVVNNATTALKIGDTINTSFEDTDVSPGVEYVYWVKAKNSSLTSNFSSPDTGYSGVSLGAVADLLASRGISPIAATPNVVLQWTPLTGAQVWDVYRNTTDSFATATKIAADRTPFSNWEEDNRLRGPSPIMIAYSPHILFYDPVPSDTQRYYYWVVGKSSMGGLSSESNSAYGWARGFGDGLSPAQTELIRGDTPATTLLATGYTEAYISWVSGGASGAGASTSRGGSGGGGGPYMNGKFAISGATPTFRIVSTPATVPAGANSETSGSDGSPCVLEFAPDGATWATVMSITAPTKGLYNASADSAGGAAGVGTLDAAVTEGRVLAGKDGYPSEGAQGGAGGWVPFVGPITPAHPSGNITYDAATTNHGGGSGGSNAHPTGGSLLFSGDAANAIAVIHLR